MRLKKRHREVFIKGEFVSGFGISRQSSDTEAEADTRTQNIIKLPENAMTQPEGDWDLVHGELMTFANPGFDLPPIDRLEAFDPNGRCVYTRVLVAVETNDLIRPVWLYHYNPGHNAERITSGKWR